jgi:hypothetical protein
MNPTRYETQADGKLAAWIAPGGDRVLLRRAGEWLSRNLGAEAYERFIALDRIYWDFSLGAERLTLLWDQQAGIAVLSNGASPQDHALVRRVAELMVERRAL